MSLLLTAPRSFSLSYHWLTDWLVDPCANQVLVLSSSAPDPTRSDLILLCSNLSPHLLIMRWFSPTHHTSFLYFSFSLFFYLSFSPFPFLSPEGSRVHHPLLEEANAIRHRKVRKAEKTTGQTRQVCVCVWVRVCVCVSLSVYVCALVSLKMFPFMCVYVLLPWSHKISFVFSYFLLAATGADNLSLLNTSIFHPHPSSHSASNQCLLI